MIASIRLKWWVIIQRPHFTFKNVQSNFVNLEISLDITFFRPIFFNFEPNFLINIFRRYLNIQFLGMNFVKIFLVFFNINQSKQVENNIYEIWDSLERSFSVWKINIFWILKPQHKYKQLFSFNYSDVRVLCSTPQTCLPNVWTDSRTWKIC